MYGQHRVSGPARRSRATRLALSLAACTGLVLTAVDSGATPSGAGTTSPAAPHAAGTAVAGPDHTSRAFFLAVLKRLGLPRTQANLDALYAVEHREGDNDRYNPLNVVQPEPGSASFNSVGVQRYATFQTGVDGTVHLLRNGHWTGVRHALRGGRSTTAVLRAFSNAYTWDNGITFQRARALLDAEAVRDVGGRYADTHLAAARATRLQSGLRQALAAPMATYLDARSTSAQAHRAHADHSIQYTAVSTTYAAQAATAAALARRANAEHAVVVQTITSQYFQGDADGSVDHLLASRSVTDYLNSQALAGYVTAGQQQVFHHYLVEQRRADTAAALAARSAATAATLRASMRADQRTWATADAQAARSRAALVALLGPAQRASITQPVAVGALGRMRAAGR